MNFRPGRMTAWQQFKKELKELGQLKKLETRMWKRQFRVDRWKQLMGRRDD